MNYLQLQTRLAPLCCFTTWQVSAIFPGFNRTNFTRWVAEGKLIHLRRGLYAFSEAAKHPDFALFVAGKIYRPSYISLHSALAHYGIIPEAIIQITSISTLKTAHFTNAIGQFSYRNLKEALFFGYQPVPLKDGRSFMIATPEKALLDLLHLNPSYRTAEAMVELRLDDDYMANEFDWHLFNEYLAKFHNATLNKRAQLVIKVYSHD